MQAEGARRSTCASRRLALAHVPGALSVPAGGRRRAAVARLHADFADHVAQPPATPDSALILACDAGAVSRAACGRLIDAGYGDVAVVRGGLDGNTRWGCRSTSALRRPPTTTWKPSSAARPSSSPTTRYAEGPRPAIRRWRRPTTTTPPTSTSPTTSTASTSTTTRCVPPAARHHPPTHPLFRLSLPQMTALAAEVGVEVPTEPPHTPQVAETTAAASALADTGGAASRRRRNRRKRSRARPELVARDSPRRLTGSVSMTPSGSATPAAARRRSGGKGRGSEVADAADARRLPPAAGDVSQLDYPGMADRDELTKLSVKELRSSSMRRVAQARSSSSPSASSRQSATSRRRAPARSARRGLARPSAPPPPPRATSTERGGRNRAE